MKNKNLELQEKINALMIDVELHIDELKNGTPDDEYLCNKYCDLYEELDNAHSTILGIGRAEDKLKNNNNL